MKRNIIIFTVFISLSFSAYAYIKIRQKVAIISIYKESGILFIKDGAILPRPVNYELKKIDGQNYSLVYRGNKPKVLYLNERPIYITPGDKVQLRIDYISEPGMERDTIIANGDNAANYIYSYLTLFDSKQRRQAIHMEYPNFADSKYSKATISLFDDVTTYTTLSWKYVNSVLSDRKYNSNIIQQAEQDLYTTRIFGDRYLEEKLVAVNKIQSQDFTKKFEQHFTSRNISPLDTTYSLNIEGAMASYFGHLKEVKFGGVKNNQQLSTLISYIKNYPNNFVREYFLFFLMQNYQSRLIGDYAVQIKSEIDKIENPVILAALKSKVKKVEEIPELTELLRQ